MLLQSIFLVVLFSSFAHAQNDEIRSVNEYTAANITGSAIVVDGAIPLRFLNNLQAQSIHLIPEPVKLTKIRMEIYLK